MADHDVRCPQNPSKMFFRIQDGLIEVACRSCRDVARRTDPLVLLVLHAYDPATGELVRTNELSPIRH